MNILSSVERALLLSIKPRYSQRIFSGDKTIELRRTRPRIKPGEIILIYESSPTMAVIGAAYAKEIIVDSPSSLWELARIYADVSHSEYRNYFSGSSKAVGIVVSKPWRFEKPTPLSILRSIWANFHPPQSFRYINKPQLLDLMSISIH